MSKQKSLHILLALVAALSVQVVLGQSAADLPPGFMTPIGGGSAGASAGGATGADATKPVTGTAVDTSGASATPTGTATGASAGASTDTAAAGGGATTGAAADTGGLSTTPIGGGADTGGLSTTPIGGGADTGGLSTTPIGGGGADASATAGAGAADAGAAASTDIVTSVPATDPFAAVATDPAALPQGAPVLSTPTPTTIDSGAAPAGGDKKNDETYEGPPAPIDNQGTPFDKLPSDDMPPAPPDGWKALDVDTAIVFGLELYGDYLTPWTKTKSWVMTNVIADRYLRSVDVLNIEIGTIKSWVDQPTPAADEMGNRRLSRKLLQGSPSKPKADEPVTVNSGVQIRMTVKTSAVRVESEVRTIADGVSSGSLAKDLTLTGIPVANVTLTEQPQAMPYDQLQDPNANSDKGTLPSWAIGVIVGVILVLLPVPIYILVQHRRKKHKEAVERQEREAAMLRNKMQSRIIRQGGRTFTVNAKGDAGDDLMVRTSSAANLYSYGGDSFTQGHTYGYSETEGSFSMHNSRAPGYNGGYAGNGAAGYNPGMFNPGMPPPMYYNNGQRSMGRNGGSVVHPYNDGASASSDGSLSR